MPHASPSLPADPAASPPAALVDAARAGDRAAFAGIYRQFAPVIHGILLSHVPPADADDLTQDVFVTAMRALADLRDPAALGAWLVAAARNRARSFLRDRARRPKAESTAEPATREPANGLRQHEVLAAIRDLPEAYRESLVLRLVEGLTGPEIAARTGLTHGSVRVNLHRGMELLRAKLAPAIDPPASHAGAPPRKESAS